MVGRCCGCPDSLDVLDKLASKYLGTVDFYAVNINASEIPKYVEYTLLSICHMVCLCAICARDSA